MFMKELEKIKEILKDMSLEDLKELRENPNYFRLDEIIKSKESGEKTVEEFLKTLKSGDCFMCNNVEYFRKRYLSQTSFGIFKAVIVGIPSFDPETVGGVFITVGGEDPKDISVSNLSSWDISIQDLKNYFKKTTKSAFRDCEKICSNLDKECEKAHSKAANEIQKILGL